MSFFPPADTADDTGLVAITDGMTPDLLLDAYSHGIFPWSEYPVRWYSPNPRAVFVPHRVHLPRNLDKLRRRARFEVTFDTAFQRVIVACARTHVRDGTWITRGFVEHYTNLYQRGHAHSVEVWQDGALVGGLYGVHVGGLFAGESMFYTQPNASKVAFKALLPQLDRVGVVLLDAQVINAHTAALGAVCVPREHYLAALKQAVRVEPLGYGEPWPAQGFGPPGDDTV